jgi:hypothetical protein
MFDLRTNRLRYETNVGNAVTCIELDRKDIEMNKMVVTTLESKFRVYDLRTQHATEVRTGVTHAHRDTAGSQTDTETGWEWEWLTVVGVHHHIMACDGRGSRT